MLKRIFFTLLLLSLLASCVIPAPLAGSNHSAESNWWRTAVFYEIFVRSFYDTDNDGIGDFNGITQKLDYLESLGITAIWLMPIHPSPSYHGYDVLDYYAVNPEYGNMGDFKNLLEEAHKRGIRIIIDLVLNHTSSQHPWFVEANSDPNSKHRGYYVWEDEDKGNGWHEGNQGFYYGLFWGGMPDLNYTNPAVTEDVLKVTDYWLNEIGVDGFRVDAVKHLIEEGGKTENTPATYKWLEGFYKAYKKQNPNAYTIGEVFNAGSSVVKSYTGDKMDHVFNFEMASGFVNSANGGANSGVSSAIKFSLMDMPDFNFATFLTNHDQNRAMSVFYGNVNKAKVASFLMLTSPGTPYIYYGEEIGMQGQKPDEDIRLPMQWSADEFAGFSTSTPWRAPYGDYTQVNVVAQEGDPNSLLEHYRALILLRKDHTALQTGEIALLEAGNSGIFVSLRSNRSGAFLILANLTDKHISEYGIKLNGTNLAESAFSVETLFGAEQSERWQSSGEAVYKPLESLSPYAMYVLKINP
ncbi:MAG: alpha-amylase family glycosyl hydrolase [Anaerolineales bacterium]|nr:MAG: alpha-amylase family glycosyl hydrolase [Anaerolineales bacterium]